MKIFLGNKHLLAKKRILLVIVMLTGMAIALSGCKKKNAARIVLTSEFEKDEVFRLENISCYVPEVMVYLVNSENQYREVFGDEIWQKRVGDSTLEGKYKETILARIAQIKTMTLLADHLNVELSEDEEKKVNLAAIDYFANITEADKEVMGADVSVIAGLYHDFALANKVYDYITEDINPEISDDEARTITVNGILIKTFYVDENGVRHEFSEDEKQSAYQRILAAKQLVEEEGAEFDIVAAQYNEDTQNTYSFGRGVMPQSVEDAAFSLDNDEVSDIIESEYGYHLLRCVTTFNKDETEANKANIIELKKQEAFNSAYDAFIENLTSNLNEPLWESITYDQSRGATTVSFFDIYDKFFTEDIREADRPRNQK